MKFIKRRVATLYRWYGKKTVNIVALIIVALVGVGLFLTSGGSPAPLPTDERITEVVVRPVSELQGGSTFTAVGTVTAVSEARLQTESGGRVTSVSAGIGDRVTAGQILAQLDNAAERAALLQAEGAYESALVGGTQSAIGFAEAKTSALNTFRNAFTAADDTIRNLTDELFSNPTSASVGLRIDGQGQALRLNQERIALGGILENWDMDVLQGDSIDPKMALDTAEEDLTRIGRFVSDLAFLVAEQDENEIFTADVIASYKTRLSAARLRIDAMLQSISGARNALLQAEQSAEGGAVSSEADARIKQALGGLRAAQAAYERTLVRTPISGVVNAFYLTANQYVGPSAPAAIVANNGALEVTTSVGEQERAAIAAGDRVRVGQDGEGVITRISPALDPGTGKVEVKVSIGGESDIQNGSIVSITFMANEGNADQSGVVHVPLRSIKLTPQGAIVFTVNDEGKLASHPVTLGDVVGERVVITEGLSRDMRIVEDARGLKDGEAVTAVNGN